MISARLLLMIYASERSTPSAAFVDRETTTLIVAFGATAPDQDASSTTSSSSPPPRSPGSMPFTTIWGVFAGKPNKLRKLLTSEGFRLLLATTAIVTPKPLIPD